MQDKVTKPTTEYSGDRLLEDLRTHLAHHDKPVAFFFGAGTSCAVRVSDPNKSGQTKPLIPDIAGLTRICKEEVEKLGNEYKKAWIKIAQKESDPDIEYMLSRVQIMRDALSSSDQEDELAGLDIEKLSTFEETIRKSISRKVNPTSFPDELPHNKFARWLINIERKRPIEIFTVNYDILIERALEAERVPLFDGFVGSYKPFFYPESLRHEEFAPGSNWTRLWKLHGSVNWRRENKTNLTRIIRENSTESSGEMIFPSIRKYEESRRQPYTAFMEQLTRFLENDNALLIAIGFGFRDQHINDTIFSVLENYPRTHVFALQYDKENKNSDLFKRSCERKNITVIYSDSIINGGSRKKLTWNSKKSLKSLFLKCNSDQFNFGDFNDFCEFLDGIIRQ